MQFPCGCTSCHYFLAVITSAIHSGSDSAAQSFELWPVGTDEVGSVVSLSNGYEEVYTEAWHR